MRTAFPRSPVALFAILSCIAFSLLFWMILGRPHLIVEAPDRRVQCVSYTPSNGDTLPAGEHYRLPEGLIARDLERLHTLTNCVRTYSSRSVNRDVIPEAHAAGMKAWLGIWLGHDPEENDREIASALDLARTYPETIEVIVVGNEVLLRRDMTAARLIEAIRTVKQNTSLPVTYADVLDFWVRNPEVAEAVDRVTVHILPYWEDEHPVDVEAARTKARETLDHARSLFPDKPVQIGEIGWPAAGRARAQAVPSVVNQATFLREFAAWAHTTDVRYNIIEAIDQPWKRRQEGTVGGSWGVLDAARAPKFPMAGPVYEWPHWERGLGASLSGLAAGLFLPMAFLGGRSMRNRYWVLVTLAGTLSGTVLYLFGVQALEFSYGLGGKLRAVLLWSLALAGSVLALYQLTGGRLSPRHRRLWRLAVLCMAGYAALAMGIDGRYRDFLTLGFLFPALTLLLPSREEDTGSQPDTGPDADRQGPTEAWLGLGIVIFGLLGIDSPWNLQALAWAGVCLALGYACRPAMALEWSRFRSALSRSR
ncbi:hypothetical protein IHV25_01915 [Phaeovibrio sulfidiphilus]|uniref:Endo-1,3-beta-glucanase btgC n=1 Tax=Phaeovibrio sulfidiphilus TaxID=1220600 RepID=A0A8J6YL80_9PROT|nr:hypothetical protein [Phaeovibrio sulfidiphilus]MBE1236410.1 hypothetical protein [Phaeovibrio sulfidiphilus]